MTAKEAAGIALQRRTAREVAQLAAGGAAPRRVEAAPAPNRTGLPDPLKAGIEHLSGLPMDDVRVHYNSTSPAELDALAYTLGPEIHVAPGQERHVPHEAWHVVQQKQGRVRATTQLMGRGVNDQPALEAEADRLGALAARGEAASPWEAAAWGHAGGSIAGPIQRKPQGTYASATPTADGTHWDTKKTTAHNAATVPERVIAVMRNPSDGGTPSVDPPGWNWLKRKFGKLKGQWVRFHIINAKLGGPGNDRLNLVPTTQTLNLNAGWRGLEDAAKHSASNGIWTYVDVHLTYDTTYPDGIPKTIKAERGEWSNNTWTSLGGTVTLQQADPNQAAGGDYLPATQITQGMLVAWGVPPTLARTAKELIDKQYADQDAFDEAWSEAELDEYSGAFNRMYVDEDDVAPGPYPVVVRTA
ncbi:MULTISPECIES: DUF4157 domain-containing protein [Sorangium]|nr:MULTISPECIES: DUF4157 domain-containing protein [Sorangium]